MCSQHGRRVRTEQIKRKVTLGHVNNRTVRFTLSAGNKTLMQHLPIFSSVALIFTVNRNCYQDIRFKINHNHHPFITSLLTSVVFTADAGEASLPGSTHATVQTGVGVAQVDLRFAVIAGEANRAAAAKACDGVDGTKQNGGRGDEGGRAVEAQHRDTLHVVLAWFSETHVVVEWENLQRWERGEDVGCHQNLGKSTYQRTFKKYKQVDVLIMP